MQVGEAARKLRKMYDDAEKNEKALSIHLFGITYADALVGMPLREIAIEADLPESYQTEIRKGMKLAKYVRLR